MYPSFNFVITLQKTTLLENHITLYIVFKYILVFNHVKNILEHRSRGTFNRPKSILPSVPVDFVV